MVGSDTYGCAEKKQSGTRFIWWEAVRFETYLDYQWYVIEQDDHEDDVSRERGE